MSSLLPWRHCDGCHSEGLGVVRLVLHILALEKLVLAHPESVDLSCRIDLELLIPTLHTVLYLAPRV